MAAGAALGAISSIFGSNSANKAAIEAYKQQSKVVITNYNYNQKQLDMEEQSQYTAAQSKLQELSINGMQNNAAVTAALNETGYEGRNKNKITQSIEAQTLRQQTAVQDATELEVANIRSQKQALYIQTQNQLNNMRANTSAQLTSRSQMFMGALAGAAQGAALGSVASVGAGALSAGAASTTQSFSQAFTEAFSAGWDANAGLFTSLNTLATGLNSFAPKRGYYSY